VWGLDAKAKATAAASGDSLECPSGERGGRAGREGAYTCLGAASPMARDTGGSGGEFVAAVGE
jgi:hypothetical protein